MLKSAHFAFALSLLLFAHEATAGIAPHMSFSRGFSSHASSSHIAAPHLPAAAPKPAFGSFGSRSAAAQKSDSALSQQLSRDASQAKALQTLDERNAARAAQNTPQAAPQAAQQAAPQQAPGYAQPAPAAPTTIVVHQGGSGLGNVVAGAMIAHSMNAHARAGYYPAQGYDTPAGAQNGGAAQHGGASFFSLFLTLCLLAAIAWGLWFAWKGVQRRRAALRDANKPNYSFKRN